MTHQRITERALHELGLPPFRTGTRHAFEILQTIAQAFSKIDDMPTRNRLAHALFGPKGERWLRQQRNTEAVEALQAKEAE